MTKKNGDRTIIGIDPGTRIMGYGLLHVKAGMKTPRVVTLGVIQLDKFEDHYHRLHRIFDSITSLIDQYSPTEMALEAPFFGKNVQSMLKLGRAQGVAMAAALEKGLSIAEYEPRLVKQAVTGTGAASKLQVRKMLCQLQDVTDEVFDDLPLDATDALAVALCHFHSTSGLMASGGQTSVRSVKTRKSSSWSSFIAENPERVNK